MTTSDLSDPKAVRALASEVAKRDARRGALWQSLMQLTEGRQVIHELLTEFGAFRTPFTGQRETTDFNCGVHSCGLRILSEVIRHAPNEYLDMIREADVRTQSSRDPEPDPDSESDPS